MASKNYNCTSTVGWSGSAGTNLKSIPIGRTSGGWGAKASRVRNTALRRRCR